ncbi:MAG: protein phosphatase 2C domain-containing protein [Cyanobium sp.]
MVSTPAHGGWLPAWHCTVIGAAHRRRQVVCQDFSLVRQLRAPSGGRLQLLAVADGHGGARYRCSDSGSRLACEQAAEAVEAALQSASLDHLPAWERLLAEGLPAAIQAGWLQAIQRHWQQQQLHEGHGDRQPFCPSLYGSTLGLLLLAPTWWGCTGLGDWDLVRVDGGGNRLLSEEAELPGAGEATASLCLNEAEARWLGRAQLQAIPASSPPFALLISTDGVRKSCATDGDFLELCSQMVGIQDPRQLEEGLAEISAAGSGDDLSLAVGRWSPAAGQTPGPSRAVTLPVVSRPPGVPLALLLLVPVGLAMGAAAWWARPTDPLPVIQNEAERLCRDPGLIAGTLTQRRQQFSQLRDGSSDRQLLLARAAQDPLGALIAWSRPALPPPPVAEPSQGTMSPSGSEQPFPLPASCPALDQALARQWRNIVKSVSEPVYPPPTPVP